MILVDEIIQINGPDILARTHIRPDSPFCINGCVGAWVGIEYMAQTVGAWAGYDDLCNGNPIRIGFLLGARHYVCNVPRFQSGDTLLIRAHCEIQNQDGLSSFRCSIENKDKTLATANVTVFLPDDTPIFLEGSTH